MFGAVAWTTGVYSMARHKEWRFLHPLLPLLHVFATKSLVDLSHTMTQTKTKRKTNKPKSKPRKSLLRRCLPPIRTAYLGVLLLNIPASIFVTMFYCNAPISVMSYLRSIPQDELRNGSLGFLMPCHSTPGQAYLHRRELAQGRMWALGCEPPLGWVVPSSDCIQHRSRLICDGDGTAEGRIWRATEIKPTYSTNHRIITSITISPLMWIHRSRLPPGLPRYRERRCPHHTVPCLRSHGHMSGHSI